MFWAIVVMFFSVRKLEAPMWGLRVPSAGLSHTTKIGNLIRIVLFIDNKSTASWAERGRQESLW
jgi:hypothetical protein